MKETTVDGMKIPIIWLNIFVWILYILVGLGVYFVNPHFLHGLVTIFHILICIFLLVKFNAFTKPKLDSSDTSIIFMSAILLLSNVVLSELGLNKMKIENVVKDLGKTELVSGFNNP